LLPTILLGTWVARTIILTGYPLYPSSAAGLPVDWRVPKPTVDWLREIFYYFTIWFSFSPLDNSPGAWFHAWRRNYWFNPWLVWFGAWPFAAGLLGVIVALLRCRQVRRFPPEWRAVCWLLLATAVAIGVWFINSPDPRYASHLFFLWSGAALAIMAGCWLWQLTPSPWTVVMVLLASAWMLLPLKDYAIKRPFLLVRPGPHHGMHPTPPTVQLDTFVTASGLRIHVPKTGWATWEGPLPDSVERPADLRLRDGKDMSRGFVRTVPRREFAADPSQPAVSVANP
jgi:hypothetical protein